MSRLFGRLSLAALCLLALSAALPPGASAWWIGSSLVSPADLGLCPVPAGTRKAACTHVQLRLAHEHKATRGLTADSPGVITRWRVKSGPSSPGTTRVRLRLRVLRHNEPVPGARFPFVDLPLDRPGVHRFPARIPIEPGERVALDSIVVGNGSEPAAAPIAHAEPGIGVVGRWIPPLGEHVGRAADSYVQEAELLLEAVYEPDRDLDGFGDWTQDGCPYDSRRHVPCTSDRTVPRLKISFAEHQDFLRTRRAVVWIHSNELARAVVYGSLQVPRVTWGIYSDRRRVPKGGWAKFVLRVPPDARRAGRRAFENGKRVYLTVGLFATDTSGNRTRDKYLRIKP
ncbi:MAG TPA: hypothetical protein VHH14_04025 [Solirubrobacterales bacterium]|nr:hypothetical protein [Solirubrobacterales bacterium]